MQSIAGKIGITTAQLSLAWLLSKRICDIPKREYVTFPRSQKVRIPSVTYSMELPTQKKTGLELPIGLNGIGSHLLHAFFL